MISAAREILKMIRSKVTAMLADVHTHMPCEVISYDAAENTCSLQPCINRIRSLDPDNLTTAMLPVIDDVPVRQFGSGKCLQTVAPQAGSYGVLHVSERSLEQWLSKGGIVDPGSAKMFDLSDGFFEPGAYHLVVDGDNGKVDNGINTDRVEMRTRDLTGYVSVLNTGVSKAYGTEVHINGDSDYAVRYNTLNDSFNDLKGELNAAITRLNQVTNLLQSWTVLAYDGGLALKTAAGALWSTPGPVDASVASITTSKVTDVRLP